MYSSPCGNPGSGCEYPKGYNFQFHAHIFQFNVTMAYCVRGEYRYVYTMSTCM